AENELVSGEVERSAEGRLRSLPGFAPGSRGGQPELVLRHAGPEAFGRVEHHCDRPTTVSQSCPKRVIAPRIEGISRGHSGLRAMAATRLEFRILGPLAVRIDGAS